MNGEKSKINKLQITAVVIAAAALLTVVVVRTGKTSETGSEKIGFFRYKLYRVQRKNIFFSR